MSRIEKIVAGPAPRGPRLALSHTLAVAALLLGAVAAPLASCASPAPSTNAGLPPAVARWMPQLTAAGQRHGVDPDLLAIVTMVESGGDPQAESPTGALGLMQVMPATARRIATERHLEPIADLRDPEVNVDYGAFYLAAQLREHGAGEASPSDRTVELAAAAYNGGEDAVRAHLAEGKPLSDETVRYKDRVLTLWRQRRAAR
jgi:soluble lytic murein transglycosylase-like protein